VITSPADAEFGRGSGQILLNSRAGSNEFHGSLFEYNRNTSLTANNWFNNQPGDPREVLVRNQFGARPGGPIKRNKTFFHFLWESQRIQQSGATTRTVYTETARQDLFRCGRGGCETRAGATRSVARTLRRERAGP